MFKNLRELITSMPDEKTCRDYVIKERWNGVISCPYCGCERVTVIEGGKRFKCNHKDCRKNFSCTVGTIMEASKIPLTKWLTAIYLITAHKRGISSYQLGRDLGISQKSSWFMLHRIREMLRIKEDVVLGESQPVEADETHIGGKFANMNNAKRKKYNEIGNPLENKTTVLGMIEREGNLVAKVVNNSRIAIPKSIAETVKLNATLITDSSNLYNRIAHGYDYHAVNHSIQEYVRGNAHTNTIEGAFSHLKRMVIGTYYQISSKHTQRYCDEFAYRFNSRKIKDADRFTLTMGRIAGRLTYKALIAATVPKEITLTEKPANRNKGVIQLLDGEIIGQYSSTKQAAKITGFSRTNIAKVCKGIRKSAGGYDWIYA
ncbi:MAG: IS1595 family transposase [Bacteroidetes bacterium]|nr:IS1595 family transposase [Bacteroidota bacterium]